MIPERIVIASNRLPVQAVPDGGAIVIKPSEGGLATGIRPWYERHAGVWIGWPGDVSRFTLSAELPNCSGATMTKCLSPVAPTFPIAVSFEAQPWLFDYFRYSFGSGLSGVSARQKMFITHQRLPSFIS